MVSSSVELTKAFSIFRQWCAVLRSWAIFPRLRLQVKIIGSSSTHESSAPTGSCSGSKKQILIQNIWKTKFCPKNGKNLRKKRLNIFKSFHFSLARKGTGADPKKSEDQILTRLQLKTSSPTGSGSATLVKSNSSTVKYHIFLVRDSVHLKLLDLAHIVLPAHYKSSCNCFSYRCW